MRRFWFLAMGVTLSACDGSESDEPASASDSSAAGAPAVPAAAPATVSLEQFGALRWIEGTWRGSGDEQPTFYERYTFADDSTIRAEASSDSTFPTPEEAGAIRLRGGRVTTGEQNMEWAVTSLDARSVRFDPVRGARNTFVWTSTSDTSWTARLSWTDREGTPHERIYEMRRMP